jgi:hypothetical protein
MRVISLASSRLKPVPLDRCRTSDPGITPDQKILSTTPPSTRSAAPVVDDACSELT